jgi:hypothetical protein
LSCDLCDGCAEGGEAVEHGDTHLELSDLPVEVSGGGALTEQFRFADLRLTRCVLVFARLRR